jgi:peptidyl-prolyl cis-trans isomerase B (cyclophilin B)
VLRKTCILVLGWATLSMMTGCYKEAYRGGDSLAGEEHGEVSTQPAPEEPAPEPTTPVAETPPPKPTVTPPEPAPAPQPATPDVGRKIRAIIQTSFGHMEAELWPDQAPETVANFVRLAESGFYEGLPCHRMIPGFIVQFGKPSGTSKRQLLKPVKGEFSETLKHEFGTLSMARRANDPDSATSQFFICFRPRTDAQLEALATLDGAYAIFGKITRGLEVLDEIEKVRTTTQPRGRDKSEPSKPARTILLNSVRILD